MRVGDSSRHCEEIVEKSRIAPLNAIIIIIIIIIVIVLVVACKIVEVQYSRDPLFSFSSNTRTKANTTMKGST